eukprot:358052-Chlamydomonas_euryale.AAC.5
MPGARWRNARAHIHNTRARVRNTRACVRSTRARVCNTRARVRNTRARVRNMLATEDVFVCAAAGRCPAHLCGTCRNRGRSRRGRCTG